MTSAELEQHMAAFKAAYDRFPNLPEERRVAWAERIANSIPLQLAYSLTGPTLSGRFEPGDYLNDDGTK